MFHKLNGYRSSIKSIVLCTAYVQTRLRYFYRADLRLLPPVSLRRNDTYSLPDVVLSQVPQLLHPRCLTTLVSLLWQSLYRTTARHSPLRFSPTSDNGYHRFGGNGFRQSAAARLRQRLACGRLAVGGVGGTVDGHDLCHGNPVDRGQGSAVRSRRLRPRWRVRSGWRRRSAVRRPHV